MLTDLQRHADRDGWPRSRSSASLLRRRRSRSLCRGAKPPQHRHWRRPVPRRAAL